MKLIIGQKLGPITVKAIPEGAPITELHTSPSDSSLAQIIQGDDGLSYLQALAAGTCQVVATALSASGASLIQSSEDIVIEAAVVEATGLAIDLGAVQA